MPDLSRRSRQTEIMDDLAASGEIIQVTLKELDTINRLLGGNQVTVQGINTLLQGLKVSRKITVADLGCGSGDILRIIRRTFKRKGIEADLIGVDANVNIVEYASRHTPADDRITFVPLNIFSREFRNRQFDIVTATLFFHHFSDEELVDFFRQLRSQVKLGIVINDIHRHWFAYYSIKWLTNLFSKSEMVKHDAAVSVERAFKKQDLITILEKAGFEHYRIRWMWAFRWQVIVYIKP